MQSNSTAQKVCGTCKQYFPLDGFHKNKRSKDGINTYCKPCAIARAKAHHDADPERHKARMRADYVKKSDVYKARAREWEQNNRPRKRELAKVYRDSNKEKIAEFSRIDWQKHNAKRLARKKEYRQETPDLQAAMTRRYQARKANAMPAWADQEKIGAFYTEARRLTESTGIQHHVDHIYPLRGKFVSGLHVHFNLQVLTALENQSKGNKVAA